MKRIIILLMAICLYNVAAFAQKKYEMVVLKTGDTETVFNVEDIKRTYFREHSNENNGAGEEVPSYTSCPDGNHPHWIDLGLPSGTKWACCNVGSYHPELYGSYLSFKGAQAYNPPSSEQIDEFIKNTKSVWTRQYGVDGYRFTGPNGASVFLPAAGYRRSEKLYYVESGCYYWSSTPYGDVRGYSLDGCKKAIDDCVDQFSVRPVR